MSPQIAIYPPPGPSILNLRRDILGSSKSTTSARHEIPAELVSAISVRFAVFVNEQQFSSENEIDSDDARSWHWVALATPREGDSPSGAERHVHGNEEEEVREQTVAATLRLVPYSSHPPPPDSPGDPPGRPAEAPCLRQTAQWDGREPYIKIGRLATLPSHRRMGLGKLLVQSAVEWAGRNRETLHPRKGEQANGNTGEAREDQWDGLILIHAQKAVQGFWERVGFVMDEGLGTWCEEGVEHVGMWNRASVPQRKQS